jgi:hypothetical protein
MIKQKLKLKNLDYRKYKTVHIIDNHSEENE